MRFPFLFVIFLIYLAIESAASFGNVPESNGKIDSLKLIIKENKNDTSVASAYLNLALIYDKFDPDSAEEIYEGAISHALSLSPFEQGRKNTSSAKVQRLLADIYSDYGLLCARRAKILKALDYEYRSLKIVEQFNDTDGITEALNNIAYVHYFYLEDYPSALETYFKSLALAKSNGDKFGEADLQRHIAMIYYRQGNNDLALTYDLNSLSLDEALGNKEDIARSLSALTIIYRKKGDLVNAIKSGEKSLQLKKEIGDERGIAYILVNLGEVYQQQGNLSKSKELAEQAMHIGKQRENPDIVWKAAFLLQEIYAQQQNWKAAFEMNQYYNRIRDSMGISKIGLETLRQDVSYDFEKRTIADSMNYVIIKQEGDLKIQQQEAIITKEKIVRNSVIAVLIFSLIIGVVLFNNQKIKSKIAQIAKANEIRQRISRDMHDEIGASLTSIAMLSEQGSSDGHADENQLFSKINSASQKVSEQLSEVVWATDPQNDNLPSLISYIHNYVSNFLNPEIVGPGMTYSLKLPDDVPEMEVKPELNRNLFYVVKEALNNCVKHSRATHVEISFRIDPARNYDIIINDNGKGINLDAIPLNRSGLRNMRNRIEELKGEFKIKSETGRGTRIEIHGALA